MYCCCCCCCCWERLDSEKNCVFYGVFTAEGVSSGKESMQIFVGVTVPLLLLFRLNVFVCMVLLMLMLEEGEGSPLTLFKIYWICWLFEFACWISCREAVSFLISCKANCLLSTNCFICPSFARLSDCKFSIFSSISFAWAFSFSISYLSSYIFISNPLIFMSFWTSDDLASCSKWAAWFCYSFSSVFNLFSSAFFSFNVWFFMSRIVCVCYLTFSFNSCIFCLSFSLFSLTSFINFCIPSFAWIYCSKSFFLLFSFLSIVRISCNFWSVFNFS